MSRENAIKFLRLALKRWQLQLHIGYAIKALAIAIVLVTAIHFVFKPSIALLVFGGFGVALGIIFILKKRDRRSRAGLAEIAQHLNRTIPDLQESCLLILKTATELSRLERLQQKRLLALLEKHKGSIFLPDTQIKQGLRLFALTTGMALLLIWLTPRFFIESSAEMLPGKRLDNPALDDRSSHSTEIASIAIEIIPPAYTQKPNRHSDRFEISTVEGALVKWTLRFHRKVRLVRMIFSDGDTLVFREMPNNEYMSGKHVHESGYYFLAFPSEKETGWQSEYFKIEVAKDVPPQVTIVAPGPRTELSFDAPRELPIEIIASDDYEISKAFILATVSSGAGENVKFREDTLRFDQQKKVKDAFELAKVLDLNRLEMAPGDELYFHIELFDNKEPAPNRSRSETRFVSIMDSAKVLYTSSEGIAINLIPDYFRSQRQIIIDTIKLLEEKESLPEREFKSRSNALGFDQKALRLRYGQFLGEESESSIGYNPDESPLAETDAHSEEIPSEQNFQFDIFDENGQLIGGDTPTDPLLADLVHFHDSEEAATLFSESIRTQLKAALAAMWDSELHLRTFRPREALPYEYQALRLLKNIQQKSRLYVKRIGFEPPPLEPDKKRLTGKLDAIENRTETKKSESVDSLTDIRAALAFLEKVENEVKVLASTDEIQILEKAGQRLARCAIQEPDRYLKALQHLRTLIDGLRRGEVCSQCLSLVKKAFWRILPEATPIPFKRTQINSKLSKSYFKKLKVKE